MHDLKYAKHTVSLHSDMHSDLVRMYAEHYGARDIWTQRGLSVAGDGWKGTSEQIVGTAELSQTEFYNDFLAPFDIPHAMWAIVQKSPGRTVNLGIYRSQRRGPFSSESLELLEVLEPHLKRAFHLHLQISELKSRTEGIAASLDVLAIGA